MTAQELHPYRQLAAAVIQRAVDDLEIPCPGPPNLQRGDGMWRKPGRPRSERSPLHCTPKHPCTRCSALTFLRDGAAGWAQVAGISRRKIRERFKDQTAA